MKLQSKLEPCFKKGNFAFYAYHPPMKGIYEHDRITKERYLKHKEFFDSKYKVEYHEDTGLYFLYDIVYEEDGVTVKDFRTVENFQGEVDCGFNLLFLQSNACRYEGEEFETSELKRMLDYAQEAGFSNVIVFDARLHGLSNTRESLVGEGKKFASFDALVSYCKDCLSPYINHPAFCGVYLVDEPVWQTLPQVCTMYRAIKAVDENLFIQCNLLPMAGDANAVVGTGKTSASLFVNPELEENQGITVAQAYRKYLEAFAEGTRASNVTMDSYPIREVGIYEDMGKYTDVDYYLEGNSPKIDKSYYIMPLHFATLQTLAQTCKKYGCIMGGVSNSCAMAKVRDKDDNILVHCYKSPDEADMRYQLNAYLAFGTKIYSYYIYWARRDNAAGCYHVEGTTMVDQRGNKTPLWYAVQKIHAEMQEIAPILYDFNYSASTWLANGEVKHLKQLAREDMKLIADSQLLCGEGAIITELVASDGRTVYAVYNPSTPSVKGDDVSIRVKLNFAPSVKGVKRLCKNQFKPIFLDENALEVSLEFGGVTFLLVE